MYYSILCICPIIVLKLLGIITVITQILPLTVTQVHFLALEL